MAREVTTFSHATRRTRYPYSDWLNGRILRLEQGEDFFKPVKSVANSILSHARRNGYSAVALPVRDHSQEGSPFRFIEVWGDTSRSRERGLPSEIQNALIAAGRRPKRN